MFFLFAAGLFLMLLEDSLNVRHIFSDHYVIPLTQGQLEESIARPLWELSFFALLAALMASPLLMLLKGDKLGLALWTPRRLIVAYVIYGIVAFGSALRRLNDWQDRLGHWIIYTLNLDEREPWKSELERVAAQLEADPDFYFTIGYLP